MLKRREREAEDDSDDPAPPRGPSAPFSGRRPDFRFVEALEAIRSIVRYKPFVEKAPRTSDSFKCAWCTSHQLNNHPQEVEGCLVL